MVSLVRSLVSGGPEAAPGGSERTVFSEQNNRGDKRWCSAMASGDFASRHHEERQRVDGARVFGVYCRCVGSEEGARPSVVSLERSLVSEGPVPGGSERMVFRVERRLSPFAAPRETRECR